MLTAGWSRQLQQILLCSLAFTIPFPFIYSSVAIVLLTLLWLLTVKPFQLWQNIRQRQALWPWLLYFALIAASYFYSSNKDKSLADLQVKLSMLIFPLIIGAGHALEKKWLERIFVSFTTGITAAGIICIISAALNWRATGNINAFFYEELVKPITDIHAVYMAWYTIFSLSILLFFNWQAEDRIQKAIRFTLIFIQAVFFILLSSKTLILLFFLLVIPLYLRKSIRHMQVAAWKVISLIVIFAALAIALVVTDNPVKQRYTDVIARNDLHMAWLDDYTHVDESQLSNLTIRVMAWRMGLENIKENNLWLTGSGNGDAQDLQNAKMDSYNVQNWDKEYFDSSSALYNVNLHNMALQSLLMIGLPGFILFLVIIFWPLLYLKNIGNKYLFAMFQLSSIAFMMQESSLQTQAGVVYYSFFAHIFLNIYYSCKNVNSSDSVKNMNVKIPESENF